MGRFDSDNPDKFEQRTPDIREMLPTDIPPGSIRPDAIAVLTDNLLENQSSPPTAKGYVLTIAKEGPNIGQAAWRPIDDALGPGLTIIIGGGDVVGDFNVGGNLGVGGSTIIGGDLTVDGDMNIERIDLPVEIAYEDELNFFVLENDFQAGLLTDDIGESTPAAGISFAHKIIVAGGTANAPDIVSVAGPQAGFYIDTLPHVAVNGVEQFRWNLLQTLNGSFGSAASPAWSFINATDSGWYRITTNRIGFVPGAGRLAREDEIVDSGTPLDGVRRVRQYGRGNAQVATPHYAHNDCLGTGFYWDPNNVHPSLPIGVDALFITYGGGGGGGTPGIPAIGITPTYPHVRIFEDLAVDVIVERTLDAGVTIEGVLLKDGDIDVAKKALQFDDNGAPFPITRYLGKAAPGTITSAASWAIQKIVEQADGDIEIQWADGDADEDNIWDNRLALSYS